MFERNSLFKFSLIIQVLCLGGNVFGPPFVGGSKQKHTFGSTGRIRNQGTPKSPDGYAYVTYEFVNFTNVLIPENETIIENVPYQISQERKDLFLSAFNEISHHTCVRYIPKPPDHKQARLRIQYQQHKRCWYEYGNSKKAGSERFFVNMENECFTKGYILPILMIDLGFYVYENSRYDRDEHIRHFYKNLENRSPYFSASSGGLQYTPYDYQSVLQLSKYIGTDYAPLPTFEAIPRRNPERKMGGTNKLSAYDIEDLKFVYNCAPGTWTRCGRDFVNETSGFFESPSYPTVFPNGSHCTWSITVQPGSFVEITFYNLDMQATPWCDDDAIIVHDGPNPSFPLFGKYCQRGSNVTITSTSNQLFVIFTSVESGQNYIGSEKKFQAVFNEVSTSGIPPTPFPIESVPKITEFVETFQCNFDSNFCGMIQDTNDLAEFILNSGPTPNNGTGPNCDHTTGSGKYIYAKTATDDYTDAIIRTPWFKNDNNCIKYSAHLYGNATRLHGGAIDLYAFVKYNHSQIGEHHLIRSIRRNQGDQWHTYSDHFFLKNTQSFEYLQFYWRAYLDTKWSDVAIDDVEINPGNCSEEYSVTDQNDIDCDFNSGVCGFEQSKSDDFDWTRRKGRTPSKGTGPFRDHGSRKQGYFMYIEASPPRKSGEIAQLETPWLSYAPYSISLWYHMQGRHIGKLTLYQILNDNSEKQIIEEVVGNQGRGWKKLELNLLTESDANGENQEVHKGSSDVPECARGKRFVKIVIEATVGNGIQGDIAIDDLQIREQTSFPGMPLCTFETRPFREGRLDKSLASASYDLGPRVLPKRLKENSLCGWRQIKETDGSYWKRESSRFEYQPTLPTGDKTTGTGYFMHAKPIQHILFPFHSTKNTTLSLQTYDMPAHEYCIHWSYQLYGHKIKGWKNGKYVDLLLRDTVALQLRSVETLRNRKARNTILQQVDQTQENRFEWKSEMTDYAPRVGASNVAFRLDAIQGNLDSTYIAADDLAVLPGRCDACENPTHSILTSTEDYSFAVGCIDEGLLYARCCSSHKPKAIYRRVTDCNDDVIASFAAADLLRFCN